jgi:diadenosine tetraphosphate (Ap4A) HIT family hydrolase
MTGEALRDFTLDPRIAADSLQVSDLELSAVRLMRDANYPWLLLVPRRDGDESGASGPVE